VKYKVVFAVYRLGLRSRQEASYDSERTVRHPSAIQGLELTRLAPHLMQTVGVERSLGKDVVNSSLRTTNDEYPASTSASS